MRKVRTQLFTAACVTALLSVILSAQVDTGVLSGTVYDNSGAVIPAAVVNVRNVGTNYTLDLVTSEKGLYVSPPLPPGTYRITVKLDGFLPAAKEVQLSLAERLNINFSLQLGGVTEKITVQTIGAAIQTEEATISTLRSDREVKELPINDRNFTELMRYTPGAAPGQATKQNRAIIQARGNTSSAVNGAYHGDNNFLVDGIQNNDNHQGWGVMVFPEVEALDQYRVETSTADARYGRSGGTLNVGYKSGTNTFHGSLFEFLRNDALDASGFFSPTKPPLRRNLFGGVISGPIGGKDASTFFLFSYEGRRTRLGKTWVSSVPTLRMREGDFGERPAGSIRDPLTNAPFPNNIIPKARFAGTPAEKVINFYPTPTGLGQAANYVISPSDTQDSDQFTVKLDRSFKNGSRGFLRYTQGDFDNLDHRELGDVSTPTKLTNNPVYQIVPSYTHIFSPTTVNQTRLGASYMPLESTPVQSEPLLSRNFGIPNANVDEYSQGLASMSVNGFTLLGNQDNMPAILHLGSYQVSNNTEMTRSNHSISFGLDIVRRHANVLQAARQAGLFTFSTIYTGFGASDLLLGKPQSIALTAMRGTIGLRRTDMGFFVQDDWKVTRKLTLNLGLRYEVAGSYPQSEVANRLMQFDIATGQPVPVGQGNVPGGPGIANDLNNWAPRFGLAYHLQQKTVLRAGYGIYYTMNSLDIGSSLASQAPIVINTLVSNNQNDFLGARGLSDGPLREADPNARGLVRAGILPNYKLGYMQQWNFALERELPLQQVLTVAYVGTKGTGLNQRINYNQAIPGDGAVDARRRWPQHAAVNILQPAGSSSYHSLQVTARRRFASGVGYQLAYTYSHFIDSGTIAAAAATIANVPFNSLALNKGNADQDLRHHLRATFQYELPFGRGKAYLSGANGITDAVLGGWQLNGAGSFYTGLPFTVVAAANTLNIGEGSWADRLRPGTLSAGERSITRWFDTSAFANPGFRLWGNGGRNTLFGPGTKMVDFSIFKNFTVAEGKTLQFRTEVFNISNTPQFNEPNAQLGSAAFGRITAAGSEATLQRTQRKVQFALKFMF